MADKAKKVEFTIADGPSHHPRLSVWLVKDGGNLILMCQSSTTGQYGPLLIFGVDGTVKPTSMYPQIFDWTAIR